MWHTKLVGVNYCQFRNIIYIQSTCLRDGIHFLLFICNGIDPRVCNVWNDLPCNFVSIADHVLYLGLVIMVIPDDDGEFRRCRRDRCDNRNKTETS